MTGPLLFSPQRAPRVGWARARPASFGAEGPGSVGRRSTGLGLVNARTNPEAESGRVCAWHTHLSLQRSYLERAGLWAPTSVRWAGALPTPDRLQTPLLAPHFSAPLFQPSAPTQASSGSQLRAGSTSQFSSALGLPKQRAICPPAFGNPAKSSRAVTPVPT